MVSADLRRCAKCGKAKPRSEFYAKGGKNASRGKLDSKCKACHKQRVAMRLSAREGREYETREAYVARKRAERPVKPVKRKPDAWDKAIKRAIRKLTSKEVSKWE